MTIRQSFSDAIGHTPLIRLNSFSDATGCEILGKASSSTPVARSRTAPRAASSKTSSAAGC